VEASNRQRLAHYFQTRLLELRPRSVLDVGCGDGSLVRALRATGVEALGVEPARERLAAGGFTVCADAEELPARSAQFDWVALRHVPHHLPDLPAALREAWRVARSGLLLAEPWYDEAEDSQRLGLRADRLLKHVDRAAGRFHADCLGVNELVAELPALPRRVSARSFREQRLLTPDAWDAAWRASAGSEPPPAELTAEKALLDSEVRAGRVSLNGTLVVRIEKP